MSRGFLTAGLIAALALSSLPSAAQPGPPHRPGPPERHEDRTFWRERDQAERRYWRDHRRYERHRYEASPRHYRAPGWMEGYWRPGERRYVALVPGDPSRMYVFLGNRWVLREVRDRRARLDLEGAFALPVAPPPIPPPAGLSLHIVLFD